MNTRSGISSVITGLIALVAVLGTAVFFLQSNSNILSGPETQQDKQKPLPSAQAPESVSNTLTANEEEQPTSQPLPIPPKTMTLEEECEKYGISQSVCSESTLLQKKRFEMPRQEQSEFIKISNAHIWVAHNNTSTTAFIVQNTGSKAMIIDSISIRGISVPITDWFFALATTNSDTKLPVDYTENLITIEGTHYATSSGTILLNQGQTAIVYLNEAGNIDAIDAGNNMTLEVWAGQEIAIYSVSVIHVD